MALVERTTTLATPASTAQAYLSRHAAMRRLTPDWAKPHPDGFDLGGVVMSWSGSIISTTPAAPSMTLTGWASNAHCEIIVEPAPNPAPNPAANHATNNTTNHSSCTLRTRIRFEVRPEARVKRITGALEEVATAQVAALVEFQHRRLATDLERLARLAQSRTLDERWPLAIAITGASGLIGRALADLLEAGGHRVLRLVRKSTDAENEIFWQPPVSAVGGKGGSSAGAIDAPKLEGLDAVVHLAGEPVANARWTRRKRERIRESRIDATRFLCRALVGLEHRPRVMITASGIHYYGDRGSEELTESSSLGSGFLAEISRDWEAAADAAKTEGVRVAALRIGQVLSMRGGVLPILERPFRLGLGPIFGEGSQYWSWITLDDTLGIICLAIANNDLSGPINTTAPVPVTMEEFAQTLARIEERPLFAKLPSWALRTTLGEMSEAVLTSTRAVPDRLRHTSFTFAHPRLEEALRWELGKMTKGG
jgi:uncharacterized protein (TIGR01777 family)